MAGPSWLAGLLAAVMLATAVYCASRLAAAWRWRRRTEYDVDGAHVFMGVAMAGMLVPRLDLFPHRGWEVIFGVAAAWFGWRAAGGYLGLRAGRSRTGREESGRWLAGHQPADGGPAGQHPADSRLSPSHAAGQHPADRPLSPSHAAGHHAHHLLGCAAMLYMLLVVSAGSAGMSGAAMAGPAASPVLALGLALALVVGVLWAADRLVSPALAGGPGGVVTAGNQMAETAGLAPVGAVTPVAAVAPADVTAPARTGSPMSPRLAACCEIVMGLTMGYMLIMLV